MILSEPQPLFLAYRKGYIEENPFQEFHIKRIKSDVDYLTEEELMQFVQLRPERSTV